MKLSYALFPAAIALAAAAGCRLDPTLRAGPVEVHCYGSLMSVMREGRTESTISLSELLPDPKLYALGALEHLDGEITILAGEVWTSVVAPTGQPIGMRSNKSGRGAALLVTARVDHWRDTWTERELAFDELEVEIRRLALSRGIDVERPFPFLIEGSARDLQAHIVDGKKLSSGQSSHEDHLQTGLRVVLSEVETVALGFYSTRDEGVFTHHGEHVHLHILLPESNLTAHVDRVAIARHARIRFPG